MKRGDFMKLSAAAALGTTMAAVAPAAVLGLMVVACMLILVVFGYVQLYEATQKVSGLESGSS